jgi:dipeptidyl aminopeptidase/acylaminoacyl peptidase
VLAQVQGPALAPTYYLVDYKTHRADIAAEEYPLLAGVELATPQETPYAARDGTQIPAYLTRPPNLNGPLPLVVLPHDGPAGRDYRLFNWMVQFLVSRGYAVLQPQYRGSSGFGDAWLRAGFRQWGGLMQDDVTDGVEAMIKLGIADPQRVCVIGFGYGGYVALAGAAFTPNLYRCAVSIGGIADIGELVRDSKPKAFRAIASNELRIKERIGVEGDANLARRSPINAAKNIHIPLLLLDGTGDTEERKRQSERMANAMHEAGRPVELSQFRTHNEMLREIEDFLKANL